MRLTVLGCAGSFPGPDSPASAYLVQAEHEGRTFSLVLDLGNGSLGALQRHLSPSAVDAVLLTHLHPDHCADMSAMYVVRKYHPQQAPTAQMPVFGPKGTPEHLVAAYGGLSMTDMTDHFEFTTVSDAMTWQLGPFSVSAHRMNHPVRCYGYRVAADGVVLSYTGDTDTTTALTPLLTGADLALVDCAFVDGRDDLRGIHLTGSRAGQAALDAGGVRRLMLTHIPAWNDPEVCRAQAAQVWPGEVELAQQGAAYELTGVGEQARLDAAVEGANARLGLGAVVLDTTDVRGLAEFYRELLGWRYQAGDALPADDDPDWLVLTDAGGQRQLAFQQVPELPVSTWPEPRVPQQLHLDLTVPDLSALQRQRVRAEALGARLLDDRSTDPQDPLVVLADPAGHPFCIIPA
ncbi:MAG: VOC family protein [Nostocoides sp.]